MNTTIKQLGIAFLAVSLFVSFSWAADLREIYDSSSPHFADLKQIQKLVLNLEQCIKEQDSERLLWHFLPDSTRPDRESLAEKDSLAAAFARLCGAFSSRSTISNRAGYSPTRDFGAALKSIDFSKDGNQAQAVVCVGFSNLPGDESLLERFSASAVEAMSEKDKEYNTKFRDCSLQLVKHDNTWLVSSFGDLSTNLKNLSSHQGKVEASFNKGKSKMK